MIWTRNQRGGGEALSAVIVVPVVLIIVFGIVQGAIWWLGRNAAAAAAAAGAETARVAHPNPGGAHGAAARIADAAGLSGVSVSINRGPAFTTVTVTGRAPSLFAIVPLPAIREQVTMPTERVTNP